MRHHSYFAMQIRCVDTPVLCCYDVTETSFFSIANFYLFMFDETFAYKNVTADAKNVAMSNFVDNIEEKASYHKKTIL